MRGHERAVGAVAVAAAAAVALVVGSMSDERRSKPAATGSSVTGRGSSAVSEPLVTTPCPPVAGAPVTGHGPPGGDYVFDLNTGAKTPLPKAIIRSLGETGQGKRAESQYAASPDGSLIAYVGTGDEGRLQIFIAGIDGTRVSQVTNDPRDATSPAWSPDGTRIAYAGYGNGDVRNLFVLHVATGECTQITDGIRDLWDPQFTPDGSSLLYTGGTYQAPVLRTVPVAGGKSTVLFRPAGGLLDSGNGSLSPDGSLVTFLGSGTSSVDHCGPCRWVANADGTERRVIPGCFEANPAGTWSHDGSRIACSAGDESHIMVIDIATGHASRVAEGRAATWLERDTLLVEV